MTLGTFWPTALIAAYLKTPAAGVACTIYGGIFVVISLSYTAVLLAARACNAVVPVAGADAEISRRLKDCYLIGFPLYRLSPSP